MWDLILNWYGLAAYIGGALLAVGVIGGVRDEMEGIGDLFCIFAWPIALTGWLIYKVASVFVQIGIMIGRNT